MGVLKPEMASAAAILGISVVRPTAVLPQTSNYPLFAITGGHVVVTALYGIVTTQIGGAVNITIEAIPTTGNTLVMGASKGIDNYEVNSCVSIDGATNGAALLGSDAGAIVSQLRTSLVAPGILSLTADASRTGSMRWVLFYVPVDSGAIVLATDISGSSSTSESTSTSESASTSPSRSASRSQSISNSASPSPSRSESLSNSASTSPSRSASASASASPSPSISESGSDSASASPS